MADTVFSGLDSMFSDDSMAALRIQAEAEVSVFLATSMMWLWRFWRMQTMRFLPMPRIQGISQNTNRGLSLSMPKNGA